jgi:hypothetical protein
VSCETSELLASAEVRKEARNSAGTKVRHRQMSGPIPIATTSVHHVNLPPHSIPRASREGKPYIPVARLCQDNVKIRKAKSALLSPLKRQEPN